MKTLSIISFIIGATAAGVLVVVAFEKHSKDEEKAAIAETTQVARSSRITVALPQGWVEEAEWLHSGGMEFRQAQYVFSASGVSVNASFWPSAWRRFAGDDRGPTTSTCGTQQLKGRCTVDQPCVMACPDGQWSLLVYRSMPGGEFNVWTTIEVARTPNLGQIVADFSSIVRNLAIVRQ